MYNSFKSVILSKSFMTPLIAFLLGGSLVFYWHKRAAKPTIQTEVVEKIVEKEKIVYKEKSSKDSATKENKNIETRIITKPDGTTETIIVDKSVVSSESKETSESSLSKDSVKESQIATKTTENPPKNWRIGISSHLKAGEVLQITADKLEHQGEVSYRAIGPFWLGVYYSTENKLGAGVSLEF